MPSTSRWPPTTINYADYVTITPEEKPALRVVDDRAACIGGLDYGENYKVRLRTGFRATTALKLDEDKDVEVACRAPARPTPPPGKGFILPRGSAAGLPITTINVSKVGIAVYRVNERSHHGLRPRSLRQHPNPAASRSPSRGASTAG